MRPRQRLYNRIRTLRHTAGLTQRGLSRLSCVPFQTISAYEALGRELPLLRALCLSEALDVPLEEVFPDHVAQARLLVRGEEEKTDA